MERTVKIRHYADDAKSAAWQNNLTVDQNKTLELAKKNAQLEEKALAHIKTIELLKSTLNQQQAIMAEMLKNTVEQEADEFAKSDAQVEVEQRKLLEHMKIIERLRDCLKQEQARTAEMAKKSAERETKLLAKKNAQIEAEKKKSHEHIKKVEQLKESIKQEQAKTAEMANKLSELETKVISLSRMLGKISSIADAVKLDDND